MEYGLNRRFPPAAEQTGYLPPLDPEESDSEASDSHSDWDHPQLKPVSTVIPNSLSSWLCLQ